MEFNWLEEGFMFYFLETAIGVVGVVTVYVFAKMYQESRG